MNRGLARRVTRAIGRIREDMALSDRAIIARHLASADRFEDLPPWLQSRVRRTENGV